MTPLFLLVVVATETSSAGALLDQELRSELDSARASTLAQEGRLAEARALLEQAVARTPGSPTLRIDLAQLYLQLELPTEAARVLEPLDEGWEREPELRLLRALIAARLEDLGQASAWLEGVDTWEGRLLGAALGDPESALRVAELFEEETARGASAALLLAAREGARGELGAARWLTSLAEGQAEAAGSAVWLEAARALDRRLDERAEAPVGSLRLRTALDYSSNPNFVTGRREPRTPALRLALTAEGGGELSIGRWTGSGAVRVDHHTYLGERDTLRRLDLLAYSVAAGARYALSRNPSSAVFGLSARFTDVFGDYFHTHYATSIEGGPNLSLQVTARVGLLLGLYGQATDFIDVSPPDRTLSSINRDRVGQRAVLAMAYDVDWAFLRGEAMFLHDSALGEAFDAIGGALALHGGVEPVAGVLLEGGIGLTLRDYGPVGDEAVIGPAATRSELRVAAELGARVALWSHVDLVIHYQRIGTSARSDHEYEQTVLSLGAEARW